MKRIFFLVAIFHFIAINAQEVKTVVGPAVKGYGKVFQIQNPELVLKTDKQYKVIFDIFTDASKKKGINPLINTVARFLNMHVQQGVPLQNLKVVVVLHGAATKDALANLSFKDYYGVLNPNQELISQLREANVEMYVCGQSFFAKGFKLEEKSENVKMALSALTVLVEYQSEGYQIINFN